MTVLVYVRVYCTWSGLEYQGRVHNALVTREVSDYHATLPFASALYIAGSLFQPLARNLQSRPRVSNPPTLSTFFPMVSAILIRFSRTNRFLRKFRIDCVEGLIFLERFQWFFRKVESRGRIGLVKRGMTGIHLAVAAATISRIGALQPWT